MNKLLLGDCLELMKELDDQSMDMILCDLPYGMTACTWDEVIPFDLLWGHYKRLIKKNGAIVLMASQPFTSALVMSNPRWFRHEWIWQKNRGSNFATVKSSPMKEHESIVVFGMGRVNYYPIKQVRSGSGAARSKRAYNDITNKDEVHGMQLTTSNRRLEELRFPSSIQKFNVESNNQFKRHRLHPTQKPLALFEYLVKTYSREGDVVLDNCAGSGTTGIACLKNNRDYVLIEKQPRYFEIARTRIDAYGSALSLN